MRTILALALTTGFAANASPPTGVALEQQKSQGSSISGSCGPAQLKVNGVQPDTLIGPEGAIRITSGKSSLTIGPGAKGNSGIYLQDRNKLHCLSTPTGPKLVLALYCDGRSCAPVDYRVIDPSTAKVIGRLSSMDECDAKCATKALGTEIPMSLRDGF